MRCLIDNDSEAAKKLLEQDADINALQQKVDELSIQTIALQQPVASDLRQLVANMAIASELERIADHASAIAGMVGYAFQLRSDSHIGDELAQIAGHRLLQGDGLDAEFFNFPLQGIDVGILLEHFLRGFSVIVDQAAHRLLESLSNLREQLHQQIPDLLFLGLQYLPFVIH